MLFKKNIKHWFIALFGFYFYFISRDVLAEKSPYFTSYHTWALSKDVIQTAERSIFPRNAFLPSRYLLYIEDRDEQITISGSSFVRAKTQDGVEVYVIDRAVSKRPFNVSVGMHEIIFNSTTQLCNIKPCQNPNEGNIIPISRGEAFSIVDSDSAEDGFISLKGTRDEPFTVYIAKTEVKKFVNEGLITRTDHLHPRYDITKKKLNSISVTCNKELSGDVQIDGDDFDDVHFIAESFDLGSFNDDNDQLKIFDRDGYGGKGKKIDFYIYKVRDKSLGQNFKVASVFTTKCVKNNFQKAKSLYHESVVFKSSRKSDPIEFTIAEFGTPIDLRDKTGAPYLISINDYSHFEAIMKKLSKRIDDRTLAGYALTELNVSCGFSYRRDGASDCRSYSY